MSTATADLTSTAKVFHALSDEIRLQVVARLVDGEKCVCELMAHLDMAQSRLSWHLKTLADAGVISGRREGRWNYYSLNPDTLSVAAMALESVQEAARTAPPRSGCC